MAIFIGHTKRGWPGLIVAGCSFIIPAAILVSAIAAAYVRFGTLPRVGGILYAVKPVVIAVILQAFWNLARSAIKSVLLGLIGVLAATGVALGGYDLMILAGAGILAALPALWARLEQRPASASVIVSVKSLLGFKAKPVMASIAVAAGLAATPISLWRLFL